MVQSSTITPWRAMALTLLPVAVLPVSRDGCIRLSPIRKAGSVLVLPVTALPATRIATASTSVREFGELTATVPDRVHVFPVIVNSRSRSSNADDLKTYSPPVLLAKED